ncbi:MAG: hypothetical protein ABL864_14120 [Terricaulis sp.]
MNAWKRLAVNRRVIVQLLSGTTFSGILWDQRGGLLVLRAAQLLEAGREPVSMDGDVLVELVKVDYVQSPGGS